MRESPVMMLHWSPSKFGAMMNFFLVLLVLLPQHVLASGKSTPDPRALLDKMARAVKTLNYEGTFVYVHGAQIEAMHLIHRTDKHGERERLVSLAGSAREIIRENDLLTCILPDSRRVVVEKSRPKKYLPTGLLEITDKLESYYEFKNLPEGRMTGRAANVIAIIPKDLYRYGYRLWLEKENGLLLKSDLVNENGEPVEQVMFVSLKVLDEIPADRLKPATSGEDFQWYQPKETHHASESERQNGWKVTKLPGGFTMSMHANHGLPTAAMPVEHLIFTDGLSSISVFIEKPGKSNMLKGVSRMGAVNAFGTQVSGHHVTVVGEVPQAAVKLVGESVRFQPDASKP